ncbi:uncharacterized protein LOC131252619 isoform X2 [Magnolia sinica]|uniref:uncharacterized protein LOC131252619 isoform X2 n=1 Tax=Magnolia sinica TaxID=86752 RepID=UPI0026581350|nr:uncharacterized protein LOC131252619 isoform X2 [Magnolia sinica]
MNFFKTFAKASTSTKHRGGLVAANSPRWKRILLQIFSEGKGRQGRVEQGTIKVGEDVEILGLMQVGQVQATCTVKELREIPCGTCQCTWRGMLVELHISLEKCNKKGLKRMDIENKTCQVIYL